MVHNRDYILARKEILLYVNILRQHARPVSEMEKQDL